LVELSHFETHTLVFELESLFLAWHGSCYISGMGNGINGMEEV